MAPFQLSRNTMRIVTVKRKTRLYLSGVLLVCIVMVVGYFTLWRGRNFTVYDDKFKMLEYCISEGTTHTIYEGNQTVGCLRAGLRNRFGLKFVGPSSTAMLNSPRNRVLLLRYRGDFPSQELDDLRATLANGKDISIELAGMSVRLPSEQAYTRCYILTRLPTSDDSFRIDFRLKSANDPVASLRVGKLYKHDIDINSDK